MFRLWQSCGISHFVSYSQTSMEGISKQLTAVSEQDGTYVSVVGGTYRIVITGNETGGDFAVIDMLIPPGGGPGPHEHPAFHESFQVLDGEVLVQFESETFTARKGDFVNIPKGGGVHRFKNVSDQIVHLWCVVTPAGEEAMFLEIGQPVAPGTFLPPPPMTPDEQHRMKVITEKYGQALFPPDYFDK